MAKVAVTHTPPAGTKERETFGNCSIYIVCIYNSRARNLVNEKIPFSLLGAVGR